MPYDNTADTTCMFSEVKLILAKECLTPELLTSFQAGFCRQYLPHKYQIQILNRTSFVSQRPSENKV
jgi:hypothetical protein